VWARLTFCYFARSRARAPPDNKTNTQVYSVTTFWELALNLYVCTDFNDFPNYLWPTYQSDKALTWFFWISFCVIALLFLQSIAVPLVYQPLQHRQRKRLMDNKIFERKALVAAFEVLDTAEEYSLNEAVVNDLISTFSSSEDAKIIMRLLDEDGNGSIDLFEFFQVVDSIKLSIQVKEESAVSNTTTVCGVFVSRRPWQAVAQSAWFRHAGVLATVAMLISLMLFRIVPLLVIVVVVGVYIVLTVAEGVVLVLSGGLYRTGKSWLKLTLALAGAESALWVAFVTTGVVAVWKALQIVMIVHIYRVVLATQTLRSILFVSRKLRHILSTIVTLVFCIMYGYTMFGMDVFSGTFARPGGPDTTYPDGSEADYADYVHALTTVFQLVTGQAWNAVYYVNAVSGPAMGSAGWFWWRAMTIGYFVSFNVIVNLYVLSVVMAIFLDAFLVFKDIKEDTVSEYVDKSKAAKVLGIPNKTYLLFKERSLEETLYEDFLLQNHKNTIQELLDLKIIRNVGAVKKYTSSLEPADANATQRSTRTISLNSQQGSRKLAIVREGGHADGDGGGGDGGGGDSGGVGGDDDDDVDQLQQHMQPRMGRKQIVSASDTIQSPPGSPRSSGLHSPAAADLAAAEADYGGRLPPWAAKDVAASSQAAATAATTTEAAPAVAAATTTTPTSTPTTTPKTAKPANSPSRRPPIGSGTGMAFTVSIAEMGKTSSTAPRTANGDAADRGAMNVLLGD
jgi:hypothetical protein